GDPGGHPGAGEGDGGIARGDHGERQTGSRVMECIFVSSVQREFAAERPDDALLRRFFFTPEVTREVTPEVRLTWPLVGRMMRRELQEALDLKEDEHLRGAYLLYRHSRPVLSK